MPEKPLSAKARATREKILAAANDLFYQHGYNATGLERIIATAGVAKGNFYHHFRSKEALAIAVLDWHRDQTFADIGLEAILADPSPLHALLTVLGAMKERMTATSDDCDIRGCFFGNIALELANDSEAVRSKVQAVFDGMRRLIRELLGRAREAGEIRDDLDLDDAAGLILGLMEGSVLLDKTGRSASNSTRALAFIEQYLTG